MPTQKIGITHNHNFPAETAGEGTTFHCSGYHPAFDRRHHCLQPRQHRIDPLTSGYLIYEMRDNEVMIKKRGRIHIVKHCSGMCANEQRTIAAEPTLLSSPTLNEIAISNGYGFASQTTHPKA